MRLQPKPEKEYPLWIRAIFRAQKKIYGAALEPTRLWGLSPKILFGLQLLYRAIDRKSSPINPALRSLITVRVSQINQCSFCIDINSALLQKRGVTIDKLMVLAEFEMNPAFNEKERAALAYAEAMTRSDRQVEDTLFQRLRALFSEDQILELTALIAYQNLSSKFNAALGIPSQGFCPIPASNVSSKK
ncbi:MAG: carboxymuconolactone decarboxylase family protein [Bdellovibrionota bacterium]